VCILRTNIASHVVFHLCHHLKDAPLSSYKVDDMADTQGRLVIVQ
jgi:hypothetical protein